MEIEMSAQSGHEIGPVDTNMEPSLRHSFHLQWRRNFLASPLLRLPTELILEIFAHAIGLDEGDQPSLNYDNSSSSDKSGPTLLVLTSICHQLREIGIASPQLWSTVDLTTLPTAELFLERCTYEPHILIVLRTLAQRRSPHPIKNPGRVAAWEKLEGSNFNKLRSIAFAGSPHEFTRRVVAVLRRAPNISNLDLDIHWSHLGKGSLWPSDNLVPNLSTLRLRNFAISWTSPLFRNLSQLTVGHTCLGRLPEDPSIEVFLTALANCPNLEILNLVDVGPVPTSHQDGCDTVVQLRRLRKLSVDFFDYSRIGYILSHIGYPESTELTAYISSSGVADSSEIISHALLHRNVETVQHFRRSTALTVRLDVGPQFFTDNLFVRFRNWSSRDLNPLDRSTQDLPRFASKIIEIIGGDTVTSLDIEMWRADLPEGMWKAFLHGLPRLERIYYNHRTEGGDRDFTDPFVLVFSEPFEGGVVCPQLRHLELPVVVLTRVFSAMVLKRVLAERDACGRRLKRLGLSGGVTKVEDELALESFRDLVDEVQ